MNCERILFVGKAGEGRGESLFWLTKLGFTSSSLRGNFQSLTQLEQAEHFFICVMVRYVREVMPASAVMHFQGAFALLPLSLVSHIILFLIR